MTHETLKYEFVILRLLIDMACHKKMRLFVTLIEFSKAHDLCPRDMLLKVLKRLGCGLISRV